MSQFKNNLNILYKLLPFLNSSRRQSLREFFSYKTDKIQLVFENAANPLNVVSKIMCKLFIIKHACIRTAANFGISNIYYVQKHDNLILNFVNEKNKTNSGLIKWMDIKVYNSMKDCMDFINSKYDPCYICTDISEQSKNIMELNSLINNYIKPFNETERKNSLEILDNLIYFNFMKKEKIEELKNLYSNDSTFKFDLFKSNEEFIQNLYLNGKFLDKYMPLNSKPKSVIIVFGNESRGVSEYIKRRSDYKIIIPHFGHTDTSYNLSVTCGMILFYLYSVNILPGCFTDFTAEKGSEILAKNILHHFQKITRDEIKRLGLDLDLEDF